MSVGTGSGKPSTVGGGGRGIWKYSARNRPSSHNSPSTVTSMASHCRTSKTIHHQDAPRAENLVRATAWSSASGNRCSLLRAAPRMLRRHGSPAPWETSSAKPRTAESAAAFWDAFMGGRDVRCTPGSECLSWLSMCRRLSGSLRRRVSQRVAIHPVCLPARNR